MIFDFLKKKDWRKTIERETMIKLGIPICVILLLFSTIQSARFASIVSRVDQYNEGLVDEVGGFREDIKSFGDDINEMRSFLLLPTKNYSYVTSDAQESTDDDQKASSDTEVALYKFMEELVTEKAAEENDKAIRTKMDDLQKDAELISGLKEQGLTMGKQTEAEGKISFDILAGTEIMFKIQGDLKTGELKLSDISESKTLEGADEKTLSQEVIEFTKANMGTIAEVKKTFETNRVAVKDMMGTEEILNLLVQQNLHLPEGAPENNGDSILYPILNPEEAAMLTVGIRLKDGLITLNGETIKDFSTLKNVLPTIIGKIDGTTSEEKRAQEKKAELEAVLKDEAFVSMLNTLGFKVATEPRKEHNKLLYDVTDAEGKVQFSFVIELSSGMIKILKDDKETDIMSAVGENAKKKL